MAAGNHIPVRPTPRLALILAWLAGILSVLAIDGCVSIRLIADYDEQTDKSVTKFQRKMETFLTALERNATKAEGTYAANVEFYDEAKVDLSAIRVRAAALPKNEITLSQIDVLRDSLDRLEQLHQLGIRAEHLAPIRSAFNSTCTAILKLELAKKRRAIGND